MIGGHGHVVPRPDGVKARCGGPALCQQCRREEAALRQAVPTPAIVGAWLADTYGPDRYILAQGLKLASEAGEVAGAIGKRADRRPPPPEGWDAHLRDEIADVVLSAYAIAHTEGFDLNAALIDKWARVQAKYAATPGGDL